MKALWLAQSVTDRWFAWYPVRTWDGWRWLKPVTRTKVFLYRDYLHQISVYKWVYGTLD